MVAINGLTTLYALFGYPARHSYSPLIHNYLFNKHNINSVYLVFEINPCNFKQSFFGAINIGFCGLNLTMPFKIEALEYLNKIEEDAKKVGSINTIVFNKNTQESVGFNTDLPGFLKSLHDKKYNITNSVALVLGAGGVARSSIYSLIKENIKKVYIYNRTIEKAIEIKKMFDAFKNEKIIVLKNLEELTRKEYDEIELIVNCTSIGMNSNNTSLKMPIPEDWSLKNKLVFEMIYEPINTGLVIKAKKEGALVINGIDMLINQAIFSFKIWTGIEPDFKDLKRYLQDKI